MNNTRWLAMHYGSRRGFVRTHWHRLLYRLGKYHHYHDIDWRLIERLVFICKGNICRSAYAEAVARSLGIDAVSCGLDTVENAPANEEAVLVARKFGLELESHKTKPIMYLVLKKTDLLVVMEPWQAIFLKKHLMRAYQCTLLGLWAEPVLPHIQDPYGASDAYFIECFSHIQKAVLVLAERMRA